LRVGERMPELKGQTLTGRTAVLPQASAGKVMLDRQGVVRWLHHGVFDESRADELKGLLTSLAGRHPVAADPDHPDRRSEP
jgi:hypothetical protein